MKLLKLVTLVFLMMIARQGYANNCDTWLWYSENDRSSFLSGYIHGVAKGWGYGKVDAILVLGNAGVKKSVFDKVVAAQHASIKKDPITDAVIVAPELLDKLSGIVVTLCKENEAIAYAPLEYVFGVARRMNNGQNIDQALITLSVLSERNKPKN